MTSLAIPLRTVVSHAGFALARACGLPHPAFARSTPALPAAPALPTAPGMQTAPARPHVERDRHPLSIDLPPVVSGELTPAALTHIGALYLFSQLDGAGVIVAVEALVEARGELALKDDRAAEELDKFAFDARGFPSRASREAVYARMFGQGGRASLDGSGNHGFQPAMAAVCTEVLRLSERMRVARPAPSAGAFAPLGVAAERLLEGLGQHAGADAMRVSQRIHDVLARAIAILELQGVLSYFGARSVGAVVQAIVGTEGGSLGAAQRRGLAGQRVLVAAGRLAVRPSFEANDPLVQACAAWLADSGVAPLGAA
ncbi:hypothetical protein [Pendulispora albinea]|uniref:Uncharacterized protein n=1 Tax=Pendulispora albinea TaxID=2741071 RepID=A0ABZ2M0P1_9BACT